MKLRLRERGDQEPRTLEIGEGFALEVVWCPARRRGEIYRESFTRRNQEVNDDRAQERWARLMCREIIRGWRGLTLRALDYLVVPLDDESRAEVARAGEVPFDEDTAVLLYRNAVPAKFAGRITEWLEDIDQGVIREEEARVGESGASSPTGGSPVGPRPVKTARA